MIVSEVIGAVMSRPGISAVGVRGPQYLHLGECLYSLAFAFLDV